MVSHTVLQSYCGVQFSHINPDPDPCFENEPGPGSGYSREGKYPPVGIVRIRAVYGIDLEISKY